jgi:hypothetical protein
MLGAVWGGVVIEYNFFQKINFRIICLYRKKWTYLPRVLKN